MAVDGTWDWSDGDEIQGVENCNIGGLDRIMFNNQNIV